MTIDELVERVREAIRTGTDPDGRRLEGCGFGPCSSSRRRSGPAAPGCYLCDTVAGLPQPARRAIVVGVELEAGPAPALEDGGRASSRPDTRDGASKLAGEKDRGNLAFQKRRRQGPHRSNA